ncbi:ABC transporter permease [Polymorphospora sp. NPDC051019]|uniref:ABC transporter permease n=1 Tax=Polymorphospora sp. NPDC051019 TaxID=3155725 RepID=UPI0034342035
MSYDESRLPRRDPAGTDPLFGSRNDSALDPGRDSDPDPLPGRRAPGGPAATSPAGVATTAATGSSTGPDGAGERRTADPGTTATQRTVPPAVLEDVFDDPAHGEPGRDRMAIHVAWEIVLLLGVLAVAFMLYRENPDAVRVDALDSLLVFAAALGLLTLATGLTLRAGTPNLALGPVAIAAALHFAEQSDRGVLDTVAVAALAAAALGAVIAVVVVGFHVPAWAATLGAALAVMVFIGQRSAPVTVQSTYDPTGQALYFFGGFAALALLGGLLGSIRAIRRTVGRFRPVADPARRRGALAGALAAAVLVSSMLFAVVAGVLLAGGTTGPVVPTPGLEWTGLALGATLLGGTSVFGRRGGIFGSLLTVVLVTLFITYAAERGWDISLYAVAAATIVAGLVVSRLVETFGRPRSATVRDEDWLNEPAITRTSGWSELRSQDPDSWSSGLPPQPADRRLDSWGSGRWGSEDR